MADKIFEAIGDVFNLYQIAKDMDDIRKPISYALYHTWKEWDRKENSDKKVKD